MADGSLPGSPARPGQVRTAWLDWEDHQRDQPALYAGIEGPSLVTVLDAVQKAVIDALTPDARAAGQAVQAFASYRQGAARMPQYAERFADVIAQSRQAGSGFTQGDAFALLKSMASAGLVGAGHPAGVLGLTPDQLAASAQAAGHLSEAAARAVTGKKAGDISAEEYNLVTDPARELASRVAAALRAVTARVPLVVFLDTGEVIGSIAWGWLRRVMAQTGPRMMWVAGARFETEAEAGMDSPVAQFVRDIGDVHLVLMSPTRFDDAMIGEYLRGRTGASYTEAQIDLLARFTRGLPLAVSLVSGLLEEGQTVESVCRETADGMPSSVVSKLARRYLIHAEQRDYPPDDPRRDDLPKILGLAIAYGDLRTDPELLAALWDAADPLAAFRDLARRHDFVLPFSRRLHDEVLYTLRADLLDPWRRLQVRVASQRALNLYRARLRDMRARWPRLDDQLDHSGYSTGLLAALWHALWLDNQAGLDMLTQMLPVLAVADPATADAAAGMIDEFAGTFSPDQRRDLDLLTKIRSGTFLSRLFRRGAAGKSKQRRAKITWAGLALHLPSTAEEDWLIGDAGDRQVAVMILRAGLQSGAHRDQAAVATLRTAAGLTASARLRRAAGARALSIAQRLIWSGREHTSVPTAAGLAAAETATATLPDSALAWRTYGAALDDAQRFDEALAAHDRALALDPDDVSAHSNRGNTLDDLGRFEEALAAQDQALTLDPEYAFSYNNRGTALLHMGRYDEALTAFDQALALDSDDGAFHENKGIALAVMGKLDAAKAELKTAERLTPDETGEASTWAGAILWHQQEAGRARDQFARVKGRVTRLTSFRTAELEAIALCGLGRPHDAERHLLDALPLRIAADRAEPLALYDLLSDPPMPGIDRLRAIVDSDN